MSWCEVRTTATTPTGVAYMLALKTTGTDRRNLMGHASDKEYGPYQSRVSTVDFRALFRNKDTRSVLLRASISLNRSAEVPIALSDAGKRAVQQDK